MLWKGGVAVKKRTLLFAFLFGICLLVFCPDSSAQVTYASVSGDRFLCREFSSDNVSLITGEDGTLDMSFRRIAPSLSADVEVGKREDSPNAIRIVLTNNSSCNSFVFTYAYLDDDGGVREKSEKIMLASRGVRTDYYVYTDVADRMTHVSLVFSGIGTGTIKIWSLDVFSLCEEPDTACGILSECLYDAGENCIRIRGSIRYDIVTRNRSAKLALYAVDFDRNDIPHGSEALVTVAMSSGFDFSIPVNSSEQRFKGYAVAVVDEEGRILYSFTPRVPCTIREDVPVSAFRKGIHTDIGILAASANVGLGVVDVDLKRLQSDVGNGYMYALSGKYYYFDRSYVSFLDRRVKAYYENDMEVYLRLIAPADSETGLPGILADSEERLMSLYAFADFLCSRYNTTSRGIVTGIVFGEAADRYGTRAYSLKEYTRIYADSLFVVHEAAGECAVKLIVPLSDTLDDGSRGRSAQYSPRVFLSSLAKELNGRYAGNVAITVMLECGEGAEGTARGKVGFDNSGELSVFLNSLHNVYPVISDRFFCWWDSSAVADRTLLTATFVRGYYSIACQPKAEGFILSTASLSDVALMEELLEVAFYIDTQKTEEYGDAALKTLGQTDWIGRIPAYSLEKVQRIYCRESVAPMTPPFRFLGKAYFWDFAGIANDYGWSGGDGCDTFMMEKNEETNRALAATMVPSVSNDYKSELIYRFDRPKKLEGVDTFAFAIRIDAPAGYYSVTVQIVTSASVTQTEARLESGRLAVLYVDTSGLTGTEDIRCIRIFTAPANGSTEPYKLSVGSVSVLSTTLRDEALEEVVREQKQLDVYVTETQDAGMNPAWIYVIVLTVFVSIILVVTLVFRSDDDKE